MKRTKRLLLATCALSTGSIVLACRREEPLPGNPKGSHYDEDSYAPLPGNPKGSHYDDNAIVPEVPDASTQAGPPRLLHPDAAPIPLPGNPKGSHYDRGMILPTPGGDAGAKKK